MGGPAASPACRDSRHPYLIEIFVSSAGEAAGPPIVFALTMRFGRSCDERPWRAGGLAGLSRPSTSISDRNICTGGLAGLSRLSTSISDRNICTCGRRGRRFSNCACVDCALARCGDDYGGGPASVPALLRRVSENRTLDECYLVRDMVRYPTLIPPLVG